MKGQQEYLSFNRGRVSRKALARLDLKRLAVAAETQTNWMPSKLGPMSLRPGMKYTGAHAGQPRTIPFIFSIDDMAGIELTNNLIRVWVDDALLTRAAVTASISNGTFDTDLSSWTDEDEAGATSSWLTGGYMQLVGNEATYAIRQQAVTISQIGTAHALRIVITRGPVILRVGTSSLGTQVLKDTALGVGTHSIVVTPTTGTMYVQFRNRLKRAVLVDSVAIEAAGTMTLPSPYATADLPYVRWFQSADVVYLACRGQTQQRKIERRANGSWSIILYQPEDGPFRIQNVTPTTIAASGVTGNITLTASDAVFDEEHVGALFYLQSVGQVVTTTAASSLVATSSITVTGIDNARVFSIEITGNASGSTVDLQRSYDNASWANIGGSLVWTTNVTTTYDDALDNQIVYYRLILTNRVAPDSVTMTLRIGSGSIKGVVRITAFSSQTSVSAEVLDDLGGTAATENWAEGLWSNFRGWPSAVAIHDGRLWWAGKDRFVGSITDAYESFDPDFEGDAGVISRSIGFGPVDEINWLLSLARLTAGTDYSEIACRSSSFDEPLTPTNFTPKECGTQGSAKVAPVEIDSNGVFVQRSTQHAYELAYSLEKQDYVETDLTKWCPEFLSPGVVALAVQRKPDTRIHCIRSDGTVGVILIDKEEELLALVDVETEGDVVDVSVFPGAEEDIVYYSVLRGSTYCRERWAKESECVGGDLNLQLDSYVTGAGQIIATPHIANGTSVRFWADGNGTLDELTVSSGQVDLGASYTQVVVGLPYQASFKSAKLAYMVPPGRSGLGAPKKIHQLILVLLDTHPNSLTYGPDFTSLDELPRVEEGADIDEDIVRTEYEGRPMPFPGDWSTDSRLCLRAESPLPCTVMAAVIDMEVNS